MKKMHCLYGLLAILLASCQYPVIPDNEDENDPQGNLTVSIYQIDHTPFSSLSRAGAGGACTRLNFAIYNEGGTRLKQVNQTSDMANFGTASFQVEPGIYDVVIVGHSSTGNPTMTDLKKIQFKNDIKYTDTFLYYGEIEVGDEDEDLEVSLDRIVSLCRVVFTDDLPEDVTTLLFTYTGGSGAFDARTGLGCVKSTQKMEFNVASGQKQFDLYTFLHAAEGTLHLKVTAMDDGENIVCEREFDVPMKEHEITWFSGAFFTGSGTGSTGITIVINTDWAGETHLTF